MTRMWAVTLQCVCVDYFTCKHQTCCVSPLQLVSTCKHCAASILHSAQVDRSIMLKAHLPDIFLPKMASRNGRSLIQASIDRLIDWLMVPGDLSIHLSSKWAKSAFPAQRKTTALSHKPCNENSYSAHIPFFESDPVVGWERCFICNWKWKLSRGVVRFGERFTRAKHFTPSLYKVNLLLLLPKVLRRVSGRPQVVKSASTVDGASGMCGLMQWKAIPQSA